MPTRKICCSSPEIQNIVMDIANKFNISNYDHNIACWSEDLEDHGGLYKVRIRGYRDGQKVRKSFVVKWYRDPNKRTALSDAFQRECFFWRHIVPKFLEIQREFQVIEGLRIKFANCTVASAERGNEIVVMSDLLLERYIFHDRFHKLDLDHVALAVKNLAKLHALSFVLEKCEPKEFEKIKNTCYTDVQYSDTEFMSTCMIKYYNESVDVVRDPVAKKVLKDCAPNISMILNKCVMPDASFCTICHGDYWNNNMLFKYNKNRPFEVLFIDVQLARYASPVTDISYYIYMSTDHEFRTKHYDRVLSLYYATLTAVLRQCDLDINEIYPEDIFRQHLRKYSVFGLIEALISMKIITGLPEEANKMIESKYELREDDFGEAELGNHGLFVERVNGVVDDFFVRQYSLNDVSCKILPKLSCGVLFTSVQIVFFLFNHSII